MLRRFNPILIESLIWIADHYRLGHQVVTFPLNITQLVETFVVKIMQVTPWGIAGKIYLHSFLSAFLKSIKYFTAKQTFYHTFDYWFAVNGRILTKTTLTRIQIFGITLPVAVKLDHYQGLKEKLSSRTIPPKDLHRQHLKDTLPLFRYDKIWSQFLLLSLISNKTCSVLVFIYLRYHLRL